MDYLRTAYVTRMKMWADRPDTIEVRWFRADPSAKVFSTPHEFTSRRNLDTMPPMGQFPIGERIGPVSYDLGLNIAGLAGLNFCGRREAFITGGITGLDPEIFVLPDGSSLCCRVAAERDPDYVVCAGQDTYGNEDDQWIGVGGEDNYLAQSPYRQGPFLVGTTWGDVSFAEFHPVRPLCLVITNITSAQHWISVHFDNNTSAQHAWVEQMVVPAFTTVCLCCDVTQNAGEHIIAQADAAAAFSVSAHGWEIL